jgi:hypothetical protein
LKSSEEQKDENKKVVPLDGLVPAVQALLAAAP